MDKFLEKMRNKNKKPSETNGSIKKRPSVESKQSLKKKQSADSSQLKLSSGVKRSRGSDQSDGDDDNFINDEAEVSNDDSGDDDELNGDEENLEDLLDDDLDDVESERPNHAALLGKQRKEDWMKVLPKKRKKKSGKGDSSQLRLTTGLKMVREEDSEDVSDAECPEDFIDDEANLSGSDDSGDENDLDDGKPDEYEEDEITEDLPDVESQQELNAKLLNRQMVEKDLEDVLRAEDDLEEKRVMAKRRKPKFRWSHLNDMWSQDLDETYESDDSDVGVIYDKETIQRDLKRIVINFKKDDDDVDSSTKTTAGESTCGQPLEPSTSGKLAVVKKAKFESAAASLRTGPANMITSYVVRDKKTHEMMDSYTKKSPSPVLAASRNLFKKKKMFMTSIQETSTTTITTTAGSKTSSTLPIPKKPRRLWDHLN